MKKEIVKLSEAIQAALSLKRFLKLKEKTTVTPSILFNQHESLKFLHTLMKPRNTQVRLEFSIDEDLDKYEKTISLIPINIVLGDSIFAIQVGVHGKPEKKGKMAKDIIEYKLESTHVQIEQYRQVSRKNPELETVHSELYQISIDKYDEVDVMVLHNKDDTK
ncbi:MAG: hypothetical protein U5K69_10895 [Balneolaceae bacterium]|nr:hypothetical protein [Balneolaceae bacterium]